MNQILPKHYPLLKKNLFYGLENGELQALLIQSGFEFREIPKGAYIFREDDTVRKAGVVLEGKLVVTKNYADGQESVFDILYPSKIFGLDIALTKKGISAFSVVAACTSKVISFSFDWEVFFTRLPSLAVKKAMTANIIKYISDENIRKQRKIEIISQKGLRGRIYTYFEFMRIRYGNSFSIPYSREELADYLCVNRSALSHELSRMKKEGILDFEKNRFILLENWAMH